MSSDLYSPQVSTKPPQSEEYLTITFTFDGANQLVSSMTDGVTTKYAYDAAGRLVKEGSKTYRYGYLDKVLSVTDGKDKYTYGYHVDGQLASANYGNSSEDFLWDGLALVKRGGERFINEPHVGNAPKKLCFEGKPRAQRSARRARKGPRGNPVVSSKGTSYFNDMLGTTLGAKTKGKKYSAAALTAFGESLSADTSNSQLPTHNSQTFFTGKPHIAGLGHAFLFRNYRAGLAKWQATDPLGYPDGWNQLAYCNNGVVCAVDLYGGHKIYDETYGYTNPNGLGHWWRVVGQCNENPYALDISYTITDSPANAPSSFNGSYTYRLTTPQGSVTITDPHTLFSGFGYAVENVVKTARCGKNPGDISYASLEFDLVMHYSVQMTYTYSAIDPETGVEREYTGTLTAQECIVQHIVMSCHHKIME